MKSLVQKKINELETLIHNKYGFTKVPEIKISYSLNSSRVLGTCEKVRNTLKTYKITLNEDLLNELGQKYIDDVVVHEYAHAIVSTRYPKGVNGYRRVTPHGREFKSVCRMFGIDGSATTSVANGTKTLATAKSKKAQKRWVYKCECMVHQISTTKHNKIQRGQTNYVCVDCNNRIKLA